MCGWGREKRRAGRDQALLEAQSREGDPDRRKQILWSIERKLAEDNARPIILLQARGIGACGHV